MENIVVKLPQLAKKSDEDSEHCFYSKKILIYLDGQIDGKLAQFMHRHLSSCPICIQKSQYYKNLLDQISMLIVAKKISNIGYDEVKREFKSINGVIYDDLNSKLKWKKGSFFKNLNKLFSFRN
ncbi:MAG: zf-HC2 domain-containing protein [Oligoflexia bacterium]|nr:zf-HC2 domain-containing protein [Oligoflexia bacterium]